MMLEPYGVMLQVNEVKHLGSGETRFKNAEILRLRLQNDTVFRHDTVFHPCGATRLEMQTVETIRGSS